MRKETDKLPLQAKANHREVDPSTTSVVQCNSTVSRSPSKPQRMKRRLINRNFCTVQRKPVFIIIHHKSYLPKPVSFLLQTKHSSKHQSSALKLSGTAVLRKATPGLSPGQGHQGPRVESSRFALFVLLISRNPNISGKIVLKKKCNI